MKPRWLQRLIDEDKLFIKTSFDQSMNLAVAQAIDESEDPIKVKTDNVIHTKFGKEQK